MIVSSGEVSFTCSGIALDDDQTSFITTGYLLAPFMISDDPFELIQGTTISVMRNNGQYEWEDVVLEKIQRVNSIHRSVFHLTRGSPSWRVGWLLEDGESREEMYRPIPKDDVYQPSSLYLSSLVPPSKEDITKSGIDTVLYFRVSNCNFKEIVPDRWRKDINFIQGSSVDVVGSPFGISSPRIFYNSVSRGVISNIISLDNSNDKLLLTDARVSPGVEGGGLYSNGTLVGMVIPPIRKTNDIVAFNLAVPLYNIFQYDIKKSIPLSFSQKKNPLPITLPSTIEEAKKSLVLLKNGITWTSGICISDDGCKTHLYSQLILFTKIHP